MDKRKAKAKFNTPYKKLKLEKSEPKDLESAQKTLEELKAKEALLDKEIKEFENKGINVELKNTIIKALHEYNEMKDSTQAILGYLANIKNTTIKELHEQYNLPSE